MFLMFFRMVLTFNDTNVRDALQQGVDIQWHECSWRFTAWCCHSLTQMFVTLYTTTLHIKDVGWREWHSTSGRWFSVTRLSVILYSRPLTFSDNEAEIVCRGPLNVVTSASPLSTVILSLMHPSNWQRCLHNWKGHEKLHCGFFTQARPRGFGRGFDST